jgi:hypothetical protein
LSPPPSTSVARALLPEQTEQLALLAEKEAALIADLGGELVTAERDLVRRYQQLDCLADPAADPRLPLPRQ